MGSKYDIDITGRRFNHLTVITRVTSQSKVSKWLCHCDCGGTLNASAKGLLTGRTTCCGPNHFEMLGKVFGKLTVIQRVENSPGDNDRRWLCTCFCGGSRIVKTSALKRGKVTSCGCIRKLRHQDRTIPAINILIRQYERSARLKGHEFTLNREQFIALTSSNCHYCGELPRYIKEDNLCGIKSSYTYNGIDRMDSSKGYTTDNSVTCCKKCNFTKNNSTYMEFMQWIVNITKGINKIKKLLT